MKYTLLAILFSMALNNGYAQNNKKDIPIRPISLKENTQPDSDVAVPITKIYTYAERMPVPGYDFNKYRLKNLLPPENVIQNDIKGRVIVQFVVNEDGSISDCKVVKSMDKGCDESALSLISKMPNWNPGMQNGRPVKVSYTLPVTFDGDENVYAYVEQIPKPSTNIYDYFFQNFHPILETEKKGTNGKLLIQFIVNKDGHLSDFKFLQGIGNNWDKEAIKMMEEMPAWTPGKQNGKAVKVVFTIPINFTFGEDTNKSADTSRPRTAYDVSQYLEKNLRYPNDAREKGIQGRVLVQFEINEDGTISNCKVIKGIDSSCDEEALRVIKNMPPWVPAQKDGKAVKVYFTMPISFALQ